MGGRSAAGLELAAADWAGAAVVALADGAVGSGALPGTAVDVHAAAKKDRINSKDNASCRVRCIAMPPFASKMRNSHAWSLSADFDFCCKAFNKDSGVTGSSVMRTPTA